MWIDVGVLSAKLTRATPQERDFVHAALSFENEKARFSRGKIPPKFSLFNAYKSTFPCGLLSQLIDKAQKANMEVQLRDVRTLPCVPDPNADLEWLRDYQRKAVMRAASRQRGILKLPTGAGKTEIAVGLTRVLPCRWLFLTNRVTLLDQAAERYERRSPGLVAGRVGEGMWNVPPDAQFITASFQTISAMLKSTDTRVASRAAELLEWAQGVIVDECHVLPADSYGRVMTRLHNACFRIGLSGTPLSRGDKRSIFAVAHLGSIIFKLEAQFLIDAGVLAKPNIRLIECKQTSADVSWAKVYSASIVHSPYRNALIVEATARAVAKGPVFVFVKEVAHGRLLEKMLWQTGISSEFVFGEHGNDWRKRKVRDLVSGRISVIICSVVFQEGIDVPELKSVVVASGGKSIIAALQRIGRGMRVDKATGKVDFDVYDIMDRGCGCAVGAKALGTPGFGVHSGCKWLDRHARDRMKAYTSEGYSTSVEQWTTGLTSTPTS